MLPENVRVIIAPGGICCLGTIFGEEPYLSLMNYVFIDNDEIIIMSSRADSTKVRNILANPRCSLLINKQGTPGMNLSLTLTGNTHLAGEGQAEYYRSLLQTVHPEQSNFFIGNDKVILVFRPERALLSDSNDKVSYWQLL